MFIEQNLDKKILLKDVAKEANISEYHFHRIFKNLIGETVKEYLQRIKIEKASLQLKYTARDIGHIGYDYGFENHETFTRAFKRFFEVTPTEYRNSTKEKALKQIIEFEKSTPTVTQLRVLEPTIKVISDIHIAYIRHIGSYNKVGSAFQKLMHWATSFQPQNEAPEILGIVHDSPEITDESKIRYDACIVIDTPIQAEGEMGYKKIERGKYAVFRFIGPSDDFNEVYNYIYNICLFKKQWRFDDKPVVEFYKKMPPICRPMNCETEFWVPIK